MEFTKDFAGDLKTLIAELDSGRPFALNRFADGELAILEERDIPTADGWKSVHIADSFRERLRWALEYHAADYYVGVGCPCCNIEEWQRLMTIARRAAYDPAVTFSNIFVNGNYDATRGIRCNAPLVIRPSRNLVNTSPNQLNEWINDCERFIRKAKQPVFVCAGPASKILIHECWLRGCQTTLIDAGSLFDLDSRSYHNPNHPNRKKICQWHHKTIDTTARSSI